MRYFVLKQYFNNFLHRLLYDGHAFVLRLTYYHALRTAIRCNNSVVINNMYNCMIGRYFCQKVLSCEILLSEPSYYFHYETRNPKNLGYNANCITSWP